MPKVLSEYDVELLPHQSDEIKLIEKEFVYFKVHKEKHGSDSFKKDRKIIIINMKLFLFVYCYFS